MKKKRRYQKRRLFCFDSLEKKKTNSSMKQINGSCGHCFEDRSRMLNEQQKGDAGADGMFGRVSSLRIR